MDRLKTIQYISQTSLDVIVQQVKERGTDINKVIDSAKASRTEYGLKVQELIERLESQ